jgi:hypothetical protein
MERIQELIEKNNEIYLLFHSEKISGNDVKFNRKETIEQMTINGEKWNAEKIGTPKFYRGAKPYEYLKETQYSLTPEGDPGRKKDIYVIEWTNVINKKLVKSVALEKAGKKV